MRVRIAGGHGSAQAGSRKNTPELYSPLDRDSGFGSAAGIRPLGHPSLRAVAARGYLISSRLYLAQGDRQSGRRDDGEQARSIILTWVVESETVLGCVIMNENVGLEYRKGRATQCRALSAPVRSVPK